MSQSRYLPDRRSKGRKFKDTFIEHEPTPAEQEEDAKLLARSIQRDLIREIRRCQRDLSKIHKQMRCCQKEGNHAKLKDLARQSIREQRAIAKLEKEHREADRQRSEVTRYNALGKKAELVRLRAIITRSVANEMDPARTMKQQQAMIHDQTRIDVSEQHINAASGGLYGDDEAEVEELTEELFQQACDMAGLKSSEAFTSATVAPTTAIPTTQNHDDAYLEHRLQMLNRQG